MLRKFIAIIVCSVIMCSCGSALAMEKDISIIDGKVRILFKGKTADEILANLVYLSDCNNYVAVILTGVADLDNGRPGLQAKNPFALYGPEGFGTGERGVYGKLVHAKTAVKMVQNDSEIIHRALVAVKDIINRNTYELVNMKGNRGNLINWNGETSIIKKCSAIKVTHETVTSGQKNACYIAYHFDGDYIIIDGIVKEMVIVSKASF